MGVQVANPEHVGPISSFSQDSGQHNQLSLKVILTSRPSSYLSCPCLRLVVVTLPAGRWSVVAGTRGKADVLSSVRRPIRRLAREAGAENKNLVSIANQCNCERVQGRFARPKLSSE